MQHPRPATIRLSRGRFAERGDLYDFHLLARDAFVRFDEEDSAVWFVSDRLAYHQVSFHPNDGKTYFYMGGGHIERPSGAVAVVLEYGDLDPGHAIADVDVVSGRVSIVSDFGRAIPMTFDFAGTTLLHSTLDATTLTHLSLYARELSSGHDRLLVDNAHDPIVIPDGAPLPDGACSR